MSQVNKIQIKIGSILEVPINTYNKDFVFIVNGQEYFTSRLFSDLLSSRICRIHEVDATYDHMIINTKIPGDFSKFLQLSTFEKHSVDKTEILFYNEIIKELGEGHFNISRETNNNNNKEEEENIFARIKRHQDEGLFSYEKYEEDIKELSKHFSEYIEKEEEREEMKKLNDEILTNILNNKELLLKTEDQLLLFINSIYKERKTKSKELYEYVLFENVSSNMIKEFINIFNYNDLNGNIWSSISKRLSMETIQENDNYNNKNRYNKKEEKEEISFNKMKTISYEEGKEFNGIIQYLTNKTGSNIHDNQTIEISTNSQYKNNHPKNLLDFNQRNFYASKVNDQSAWICFDFKNMKIEISNYSIKSRNVGPGIHHIKNWVIEISDDGKEWKQIDEHSNYTELNGNSITKTFEVSRKHFSRFCRLRNNGEYYGCNDNRCLILDSIEFYGRIQES